MQEDFDALLTQALDLERGKEDYLLKMRLHQELSRWIPDVASWLGRPNGHLGGRRPLELIDSGEIRRIIDVARFDAGIAWCHTPS